MRMKDTQGITEADILKKIERQPKQEAGFKQLVRELGARGNARRELADELARLVKHRKLVQTTKDRFAIPRAAAQKDLISGRLSMHRDGYGFVTPDDDRVRAEINGDIFINPNNVGAAMHGDRVLVEIERRKTEGKAEGRIVRVARRAHPTVVGTFHYGQRQNYITPIDEKITQEVIIPPGQERPEEAVGHRSSAAGQEEPKQKVKGKRQSEPERHRVIGAEARHHTEWDDLDGVVVDVEITGWPGPTQSPRGRVIEILGYEDDFGVDTEIVIRKYHIPHRFPAAALEEAEGFNEVISTRELRHRRDFRKLPIVTIDGETARDFDDAVYVELLENGNFELHVHIADVAHYVREGSAIDGEARERGTSVYFPDRAVPMLPVELSTDICSLRPHLDRLVMSCVMQIDHRGEIVGYDLYEGVIRSAERMTYTAVNAILEGDESLRRRYTPLVGGFELMRDLALILNRKRVRRGSIDFDLPEPVIEFDEHGLMSGITRSERNVAHRLIEEFMLSANECVASYLEQRGMASLYRIHEKPDPKKVLEFEQTAAAFGYSLGVGNIPVRRVTMRAEHRPQRRHGSGRGSTHHRERQREVLEIPEDIHITPRMYQKLTEKIAGKPEERILSYLMLRSLKQARYSEENLGHFALAAPTYTHFTSPIRRYPDLMVHRILKEVLYEQAERHDDGIPVGIGGALPGGGIEEKLAQQAKPTSAYGQHRRKGSDPQERKELGGPMDVNELHEIAEQSSQTERRADDAERELLEWKKVKFMSERVGEEFSGLVVSVTKFGLFVELIDLFIEGLVPISTLPGDRFTYRENTKQIIGERSKRAFSLGDHVKVLVDRIDAVQHKIQFAIAEDEPAPKQRRSKYSKRHE
ncbi:MAG TPA: RNB domain-containing ribonuclease [Terriglobales bacterium]|nr:RNB domain-containing ribonuclease [Terriglobales bacterium]